MSFFRRLLLIAAALFLVGVGCSISFSSTEGSGNLTTERHDLDDFTRISVAADLDVVVEFTNDVADVELTTDDNIHEHLKVEVDDGRLSISPKPNRNLDPSSIVVRISEREMTEVRSSSDTTLRGTIPSGDQLRLEASSDSVLTVEVDTETLIVDVSSDARVVASGRAASARIDASSDAQAQLAAIDLTDADVDASSDATIEISASGQVRGKASSDAKIIIEGDASIDVSTSSDGKVEPKG